MRTAVPARQFERRDVDVRVELEVRDESVAQVALSHGRRVHGRMKNISGGGAFVAATTFLPRECQVTLHIPPTEGLPHGAVRSRVVKAIMTDREPTYGLGLRFEDDECGTVRAIRAQLGVGGAA